MKDFDPKLIEEIRKTTPNKIAQEICSVQPMNGVTVEHLRVACQWLEKSRLYRRVHPITEEKL